MHQAGENCGKGTGNPSETKPEICLRHQPQSLAAVAERIAGRTSVFHHQTGAEKQKRMIDLLDKESIIGCFEPMEYSKTKHDIVENYLD